MRHTFWIATGACALAVLAGCGKPSPAPAPQAEQQSGPWLGDPVTVPSPAAPGARFPNLAATGEASITVMSWLEPAGTDGSFRLRYSQWQDGRWGDPVEVASGKDWFINWADFPSVMPATSGAWAAHWLQQKPGGVYAYDVSVSLSADAGRTWSTPRTPHDDGTATEHGFVSLAQVDGKPYAVWLDGRATADEGHSHGDGSEHSEHGGAAGAMTVRGAVLQADGATAGAEIDGRVCDCCQTDVATTSDALVLVYRDRSDDETRDIHAARLVDGAWSAPVAVHADGWRIDACPVNGPAIAARGNTVAVAWFTAPDQPRVRLAWSKDGGRTFAAPIEVANGKVVGRVDVVVLEDGRAVVSWLAEGPQGAVIRAQPFTGKGPAAPAMDIASTNIARSSGFPQMVRVPGGLLFAWTATGTEPAVVTALAPLP
ncbi:MAG: glycoside hydrolase [Gammaproteobacteria bacterium]|nr:glycoside hydrolase [Gammaproteobacteria bacterium]MDH5227655.1 glycoside hydrolase [Gammaproteobacteria bacterium]